MTRLLLTCALLLLSAAAAATPPTIVAAASTWGAVAAAVAGPDARVLSIVRDPNADPHDFEASAAVAREVADASIVITNGLGYDRWMDKLLDAGPEAARQRIDAAALASGRVLADRNPHLFYDPAVARRVAARLSALLQTADPTHAGGYRSRLQRFEAELDAVDRRIAALRRQHPQLRVTATEPVYGYMLAQLGWVSRNPEFQFNVMNDSEPAPRTAAAFEDDLRQHRVALLVVNRQVSTPLTRQMQQLARASGVPVVAVDEVLSRGTDYPGWLLDSLNRTAAALAR